MAMAQSRWLDGSKPPAMVFAISAQTCAPGAGSPEFSPMPICPTSRSSSGIATMAAKTNAVNISSRVAGMRSRIMRETGCAVE